MLCVKGKVMISNSVISLIVSSIVLLAGLTITSVVGNSISFYHAVTENEKHSDFVVISSVGFGLSVASLCMPLFFILGFVFMIISMSLDSKYRRLVLYIFIPIGIAILTYVIIYCFDFNGAMSQMGNVNGKQTIEDLYNR